MTKLKQPWINDIYAFYVCCYKKVIDKNLHVKVKNLKVKISGLFSAYGLSLLPAINRLTQLCVKSTKSITIHKHLKKKPAMNKK